MNLLRLKPVQALCGHDIVMDLIKAVLGSGVPHAVKTLLPSLLDHAHKYNIKLF